MSERFDSRLCNRALAVNAILAAFSVFLANGCAYTRISAKGVDADVSRPSGISGPLFVTELKMDFELPNQDLIGYEMDFGFPDNVFSTNYPAPQTIFAKAAPDVFSDSADATPVVVRLLSREERGGWDEMAKMPGMLLGGATLFTIPWAQTTGRWETEVSVQLGPGIWSDSTTHVCKERMWVFNPISGLFLVWFFPESSGWAHPPETGNGTFASIENGGDCVWLIARTGNPYSKNGRKWFPYRIWPWNHFKSAGSDHFVRLLGSMIVETIDGLSDAELDSLKNNPVAWQQYQKISPFGEANTMGGKRRVSVGGVSSGGESTELPRVLEKNYDETTRRGRVKLSDTGSDHLNTLKYVRDQVLPSIAGAERSVRILRESSLEDGAFLIEFEVVE